MNFRLGPYMHSKIKLLSLSGCGLRHLPEFLKACPNLKLLNVSSNQLNDLSGIDQVPQISELFASNNLISSLSDLDGLRKLKVLVLGNNRIESYSTLVPVRSLSLKLLDLSGNLVVSTQKKIKELKEFLPKAKDISAFRIEVSTFYFHLSTQ
jgi:Leucine-rich repeat (LRR) protein